MHASRCTPLMRRTLFALAFGLAGLLLCLPAQAQSTLTWYGDGAAPGGTGTWNTIDARWHDGASLVPWVNANNDTALFGTTAGTVTLGEAITAGGLTFDVTGYTITGNTLTLAGTTPTITAGVGINATIASVIAGSTGMIKTGAGTLTLTAANTHAAGTTINAGGIDVALASGVRGDWTINNGGILRGTATDAINAINSITVNAGGRLIHAGGSYQQLTAASGGAPALILNGGTLEATVGAHGNYGNFRLGGNMVVGGTSTSVIDADFRMGDNATRTITVNSTGDPSGIDLDIQGHFSHFHNQSWGFMTKEGEGTMRFAPTSSGNVGRITVNAGKVLFDNVIQGMTNGGLINNAGGTVEVRQGSGVNVTFNQRVQGAGTFIKSGPGTFQFNGGGQLIAQGQFLIQEGTLQNNNNSVNWSGNTGNVDISAGAILDLYADPIYLNNLTGSGIVQNNYGNASGYSGSSQYIEKLVVGVADGSSTFDGILRDNATGASLAGGTGRGGIELEKRGTGTLTLRGANAYTGQTAVLGGTLALDYSAQNNSKLSDTAALVLGNAALNLTGGSHTEAVGATTLLAGTESQVTRTGGASVLQMGAITRNAGAYIDFSDSGIARTDTPNTNGILGTWATIGRADWAANSTGGPNGLITAPAYTDVTRLSSGAKAIGPDPAANVRIVEGTGAPAPITLGAPVTTIHTLNQSASGGSSAATIDPAGQTLAVNAILQGAGAGPLTIGTGTNNGTLRTATPGGDLFLTNQSANSMTIRSAIADNGGPSSLSKVGGSPVVLAGVNTYTGDTTVLDGGALRIGGAGQLGGGNYAGAITLRNQAGRLDYASSSNQTLSGSIGGSGEVHVSGPGTLTMSGASSYAGATTIHGGTLKLAAPAAAAPGALAGLVVHLDATQIAQANGSNVTAWSNLASGGAGDFTVTGGTEPTFHSEGNLLNGLPVVKFHNSATLRNLTNFGNNATVMFAGRMDGGQNRRLVGGTNNWLLGYHGGGHDKAHFNAWLHNPANVMDYTTRIYESVQSGTTASFYNNGVLLAQATNASFQGPNGLVLGGYQTTSEQSFGSIGEVLVFNRALTEAERVQMEQYLQAKWYGPLPSTTAVNISGGGVFDLDGVHQTIGSLAGDSTGQVLLGGGWLTVGNANTDTTYSGVIADGGTPGGGLAKTGNGTLTMAGNQSNTYTGPTVLQAGRLHLAKTDGAYAIPGDFIGVNNPSPVVYTTEDNQFAPGAVMYFQNYQGDHVRFELMGTTQTLGGIDNTGAGNRGVIQHRERIDAGLAVGTHSTLVLDVDAGGNYNFAGYLRAQNNTLSLVKDGPGTQTLAGGNINYNGTTTVNAGVLNVTGGAYTGSAGVIVGPQGTLIVDTSDNNRLRGPLEVAGTIEVRNTAAHTIGGNITLNNGTLDSGSAVGTGGRNEQYGVFYIGGANRTITANGANNLIAGINNTIGIENGRTLTLHTPDAGDALTISGNIVRLSNQPTSTGMLTKTGEGTVILSGTNNYTGATTAAGGSLVIRGNHTGGGPVQVNHGTLMLDLSANPGGVLATTSLPTMGGGTLRVQGSGSGMSSQTLGNLTLAANTASTIAVSPNGGAGTTLTLGNTWTRNAGAAVHFDLSAGTPTTAVVASSPPLTNGIIGGWATVRDNVGTGFATVTGGNVVRYAAGSQLRSFSNDAAGNFTSTPTDTDYVAGTLTMDPGPHSLNTVAFNSGAGGTLNLNGTTMAVGSGLLFDGAGDYRVENGTISGEGATLSKFGSGTLTLANTNTYTGATTISGGTLRLENSGGALPISSGLVAHWDAAAITGVADGARLDTWTDSSASARNATRQGGTPVYLEDGGSGLPVVRFETSGDSWYNFADINDIRSLFFVGKEVQTGSPLNYFLGHSGSYHFHRGDNDVIWHSGHASANIRNGQTYLDRQQVNGTSTAFGPNWMKMLSLVTTGNVQANQLSLDRNIGGRSWRGDIGEILVFNQALSEDDRLAVEQYLMGKWFGVLPSTTAVTLTDAGAALDLNGVNQTIGSLSGVAGSQVLLGGGTLTVGKNNMTTTFSGVIADGSAPGGGFTKDGTGTLTLAGDASNTYTGSTMVQTGRLQLAKTGGAYAVPGDLIVNNNTAPVIYTTQDNQLAPGAVMSFEGTGNHARFELLGTTQTLAGIVEPGWRGVIQHREHIGAEFAVGTHSTLVLDVAAGGDYFFGGYLRSTGGTVSLVKEGPGTQTLSGSNISYTGATTILGGTLVLNTPDVVTYQGGHITIDNGATLRITRSGGANRYDFNNKTIIFGDSGGGTVDTTSGLNFVVYGGSVFRTTGGPRSNIIGASGINLHNSDSVIFDVARGSDPTSDLTVSTHLSNSGGVIKTGDGILTLAGNNTYTGATTINGGVLNLHIPGGAHHTYTGGTISINNGSTLQISRSEGANQYWFNAKTFQFGDTGGGTIDTTSGMNVVVYGGSLFRTTGGAVNSIIGASGINLHNGHTITLDVARGSDPASDLTVSAPLWNSGGVTKTGDGIVTLTGTSDYTGPTTINAGTLMVHGSLGNTAVAVNSGATLGGTGSIAGTVTINAGGTHAPGASVGSQTVGGETWMPGGRFEFEINDALGQPGGPIGWDQLLVGGTLDLTALTAQDPFHIDIVSLSGTTPGNIDNFVATVPYEWPFLRYDTLLGEFNADLFSLDSSGFSNPTGRGHFEIVQMDYEGADWLAIGYVPEPGTWLLLLTALACGLSLRRRSRR